MGNTVVSKNSCCYGVYILVRGKADNQTSKKNMVTCFGENATVCYNNECRHYFRLAN